MQLGQIPLKNYLCFNKIYGEFGSLTHYDYGFRIYNQGIGKFLSVDPLTKSYPWYTPYQFAGNKPIAAIDLDGLEEKINITIEDNGISKLDVLKSSDLLQTTIARGKGIDAPYQYKVKSQLYGELNISFNQFQEYVDFLGIVDSKID